MLKLKQKILEILSGAHHPKSPEAEANLILFHAFQQMNPQIRTFSDLVLREPALTPEVEKEALRIAQERATGKPLQHLLGHQFFLNHEYRVNESVLIPRPETEILAQHILEQIEKTKSESPFRFAELGLGSGILSCEVLARFPQATGLASETSPQAIAVAQGNLTTHLEKSWEKRLQLVESQTPSTGFELFIPWGKFDFIFSNPPYVSVADEIEEEVLRYEPHLALYPEATGENENPDFFYENFLKHSHKLLTPNGIAFFEIPHERADVILSKFQKAGFSEVHILNDLTGRARVLTCKMTAQLNQYSLISSSN